jgi:hypothetical protein
LQINEEHNEEPDDLMDVLIPQVEHVEIQFSTWAFMEWVGVMQGL